ncbi:hypothetical protein LSAT2_030761, partial [Lamellibrachia satsuma]
MTTERFVAIRFPFWAHVHLTRRKSVQVIVGVAMAIPALDVHNLFTRTMIVNATTGRKMCLFSNSATVDMSYGFFHIYIWAWIDASVYSFFPLTMLVVFNVLIIHSVRQRAAEMKQLSDADTKPGTRATSSGTEQQITTMLLSVTFAFIILTGPVAVTLILEKFWDPPTEAHGSAIWRLWRTIVSNLLYTNHAINFLLYSLSGQKFRRELRRLLTCGYSEPTEGGSRSAMQVSIWVLGISAFLGNLFVIVWRIRTDTSKASSFFVINLGCSDFLMGLYLLIIGSVNAHYSGVYIVHANAWRSSKLCQAAGYAPQFRMYLAIFMSVRSQVRATAGASTASMDKYKLAKKV